jgi:hypothetical protein
MQMTRPQRFSLALPVVRWGARIHSAGILLFWGWFLIAHLLSAEGLLRRAPAPVVADYAGLTADYAGLTAIGIALLGFAVAWRWDLIGAVMALGGYVIGGLVNWLAFGGPFILWPIAAMWFLSSWWLRRAAQRDAVTMPSGGSM